MIDFRKVFLDTAPFIYYIEGNEHHFEYRQKVEL